VFGGGQCWPNALDPGGEELLDHVGCGGGLDPEGALGDDPTWILRWQAAIFRRTAFGQAGDLWWLALARRSRGLRTGAGQVFPAMEGGIERARAGLHPGVGGEALVVQRAEAHLTPPLLPGLLPGTDDRMEGAVPRGWRE